MKRHCIDIAIALADDDVDGLAELDLPLDRLAFAGRRQSRPGSASTIAAGVSPAASTLTTARSLVPPVRTVTTLPTGTEYSEPGGLAASPVRKIGAREV